MLSQIFHVTNMVGLLGQLIFYKYRVYMIIFNDIFDILLGRPGISLLRLVGRSFHECPGITVHVHICMAGMNDLAYWDVLYFDG